MNKSFKDILVAASTISCGLLILMGCNSSSSETKVKTADSPATAVTEIIELKRGILKSSLHIGPPP